MQRRSSADPACLEMSITTMRRAGKWAPAIAAAFSPIITMPKDTSAAVVIEDFSEVQNLLSTMNK